MTNAIVKHDMCELIDAHNGTLVLDRQNMEMFFGKKMLNQSIYNRQYGTVNYPLPLFRFWEEDINKQDMEANEEYRYEAIRQCPKKCRELLEQLINSKENNDRLAHSIATVATLGYILGGQNTTFTAVYDTLKRLGYRQTVNAMVYVVVGGTYGIEGTDEHPIETYTLANEAHKDIRQKLDNIRTHLTRMFDVFATGLRITCDDTGSAYKIKTIVPIYWTDKDHIKNTVKVLVDKPKKYVGIDALRKRLEKVLDDTTTVSQIDELKKMLDEKRAKLEKGLN